MNDPSNSGALLYTLKTRVVALRLATTPTSVALLQVVVQVALLATTVASSRVLVRVLEYSEVRSTSTE
jgi:hypothetical protein